MTNSEKKLKEKGCIDKIIHTYKKKKKLWIFCGQNYTYLYRYISKNIWTVLNVLGTNTGNSPKNVFEIEFLKFDRTKACEIVSSEVSKTWDSC